MEAQTLVHASPACKSLHVETEARALRHCVWVSLFLAQDLALPDLQQRLMATLVEVDRLLVELDLA